MKTIASAIICTFCLLLSVSAQSQQEASDPATLVIQGNMLYQRGEFVAAAKLYQQAFDSGLKNGHLHYNLANSYYRQQLYGKAIAQYRRALSLLPGDPDVLANLKLARKNASGTIAAEPSPILDFSWLLLPREFFTDYQIKEAFVILFLLFWLSWLARPLFEPLRNKGVVSVSLVLLCYWGLLTFAARPTTPSGYALALTPSAFAARPAVVVNKEVSVRSGNGQDFQVVAVLGEGAEVQTAEQREHWVEVLLPEGRRGWTEIANLEIL